MQDVPHDSHPLIRFLRDGSSLRQFGPAEWERLIRAARHGLLLSHVACRASRREHADAIPPKVRCHLASAMRVAASQARSVKWEVRKIAEALGADAPFILLKGAAYIAGNLDAAAGRLLSDVDVLVRRDSLAAAEKALFDHGWFPTKLNAYDQRYYRLWMHELPPMQNLDRGTVLDLHHTILPPTARLKPDVEKLWQDSVMVDDRSQVRMLAPVDMILHSATHLFHDGEFEHGLRDLVDIDALLQQFADGPEFWPRLVNRAIELDLARPLHYALRYCRAYLRSPIPDLACDLARRAGAPPATIGAIMDAVVARSLSAILEARPARATRLAQFSMYVRSHYLRMPLHLLLPHLLRKQFLPEAYRT